MLEWCIWERYTIISRKVCIGEIVEAGIRYAYELERCLYWTGYCIGEVNEILLGRCLYWRDARIRKMSVLG